MSGLLISWHTCRYSSALRKSWNRWARLYTEASSSFQAQPLDCTNMKFDKQRLQDICSLRAQKEDEKVELQNLEKEKAAMQELLDAVRSKKEKEQVASFAITFRPSLRVIFSTFATSSSIHQHQQKDDHCLKCNTCLIILDGQLIIDLMLFNFSPSR